MILMSNAIDGTGARLELELEREFEANIKLVYFVIHRYFLVLSKDEDIIQTGMLGLWKALQRFDPKRGVTFSTYAVPVIWGTINRFRKPRRRPDPPMVSLDALIRDQEDGDDPITFLGCLEQPGPGVEEMAVSNVALRDFLARCNERQKRIAIGLMQGHTQQTIGSVVGISQAQVSRTIKSLRQKLGPRPAPRPIKPCEPPRWEPVDLIDPEPDPAKRRHLFRVQITSPRDQIQFKPVKRRACKTKEGVKGLLAQGIKDPWEIASALGVGVEAARRWIKILEEA